MIVCLLAKAKCTFAEGLSAFSASNSDALKSTPPPNSPPLKYFLVPTLCVEMHTAVENTRSYGFPRRSMGTRKF